MKKIVQIFKKIAHFIDRKVIVPITKLIVAFTSKFDHSGRKIENWLSKTNTILFVSLFLAIGTFILIDQKIILFNDNSAEVLKSQPVKVIYNEEAYVIEGLPEEVDVTLIGSKTDLYIAKQSSSHEVVVDLSGLKPGTHKVNIKYNQNAGNIEYMVNPSVATVIIYQKVSETKTLSVDVFNQDSLDSKLVIEEIKYDTDKVVIKGAEHQLKQVATVKALVDVKNLVSDEVGKVTLKDVPLRAYDALGNVVDVEIVPGKIDVDVTISSPSKEVVLKVVPKGEVSFGKAISSVALNERKVTVYGNPEALANLKNITIEIDVNNLKENKTYKVEIPKPIGVKTLSINNVTITVTLDNVTSRNINNITIDPRNLADGYKANILNESDARITVNLKGVKSVIDAIKAENVLAYVDLSDCTEGEHEIEVKVEGENSIVQYTPKVKKIKIVITKK